MQKGIVYRSTGSWYDVKIGENLFIKARIQGKFRTQAIKTTNPVAVGDEVDVLINDHDEAVIKFIHPRKNYIIRKSVNLSKEAHIIAANIDLAVLIVTVINPVTPAGFIDRFTVTAEAYNIPLLIVFNKVDIYDSKANDKLLEFEKTYSSAGYRTLSMSVLENIGLEDFKENIQNKSVLISGNSGAGKSTLINALIPNLNLKTGEISASNRTGKHTTTFAEMFDLNFNARIIDTPGIKGFGVVDIDKYELGDYFPEFFALKQDCKFNNCIHTKEPNCAIKAALEEERISWSRYKSYLQILEGEDETAHFRTDIWNEDQDT